MKNTNQQKGFTLVETLVAIAVLILAVTGAFSAAQSGISSYNFSKNQIIAFNLAQEGVETLRVVRDENSINNRNWLTGLTAVSTDPCYFGKTCMIDLVAGSISPCNGGLGSCPTLNQETNGYYTYMSGTPTTFKREIQLTQISPTEISALVSVTWSKGIFTRQFKVRENLYDW